MLAAFVNTTQILFQTSVLECTFSNFKPQNILFRISDLFSEILALIWMRSTNIFGLDLIFGQGMQVAVIMLIQVGLKPLN